MNCSLRCRIKQGISSRMMSLLLIDMDGTLREPLSGQQHFQHPKDQHIIAGAEIAIRAYKDDWIIVGITNQGGVGAGHKVRFVG